MLLYDFAEDVNLVLLDLDSLDERDGLRILWHVSCELLARVGDELVGDDEDESVRALDRLEEVGFGMYVVTEVDAGQVLDVFVLLVDLRSNASGPLVFGR